MDEAPATGLNARLAGELATVARTIEDLAVDLCMDPVVFERHAEPLQRFDQVVQVIGEIAAVLRSAGAPAQAVAAIRLDALRERMTDGLL